MTSITTMVKKIAGLQDTQDLTDWESDFVESILARTRDGDDTSSLTEKQIDVVERIHKKHFAD